MHYNENKFVFGNIIDIIYLYNKNILQHIIGSMN